jgi:hypothetical protein
MTHRYGRAFGTALVVTALAAGALAFVGGFVHGEPAGRAAAEASLRPRTSSRPAIEIGPGDGNALRTLLRPPAGAAIGPVEVLDAVGLGGLPTATAALQARGFEIAAVGAWTDSGTTGSTELLQFTSPTGAQGYALSQSAPASGVPSPFPATGGAGFVMAGETVLVGSVGPYAVRLAYASTGAFGRDAAQTAFEAQERALYG